MLGYVVIATHDTRLKRHESKERAAAEAARLAEKEPGKVFVVLKSEEAYAVELSPVMRATYPDGVHAYKVGFMEEPREVPGGVPH